MRTSSAASTMNDSPIGPDRYAHHWDGSGAGAAVPTSASLRTSSRTMPAVKFTTPAVHGEPERTAT